jgi:hypothetical protein
MADDEDMYNVERILDKKFNAVLKKYQYLIKWEGYGDDQNTWEPVESLESCPAMLAKFERRYARREKRKKEEAKKRMNSIAEKRAKGKKKKSALDSSSDDAGSDESSEWEDAMQIIEDTTPNPPETVDLANEINFTHEPQSFNTDIADTIIGARGFEGKIYYCVRFKKRRDGTVPHVKIYEHQDMVEKYPPLLIDYLLNNAN